MAILSYRDKDGNIKEIPALRGEKGDPGSTPIKGVDYYTEEEKNELIAESKAIIITSNNNVSSMSSQEITEAIQNGKVMYLEAFENKYVVPQYIETGKITFEYPVTTSVEGIDGNTYVALNQRTVAIRDNSISFNSISLPGKDYVDAQTDYLKSYIEETILGGSW